MLPLDNPFRRYDWGSVTAIPELLGLPADGRPLAEVWLGDHPAAPSSVRGGPTLPELFAADGERYLGTGCLARFGPRLPFLMKILAAARPLSIQVHPSSTEAARGFAAEERVGLVRTDPRRAFPDGSHKPEMLLALTRFTAFAGFRDPERTIAMLAGLEAPLARRLRRSLEAADEPADEPVEALLRRVVLGTLDGRGNLSGLDDLGRECAARAASREWGDTWTAVARTAAAFPDDRGVLVALLLNTVTMEPGEALFVPAGAVHAYVAGMGIELMAASDNVVRAALTAKRVDIGLFARLADWRPAAPAVVGGVEVAPGVTRYPAPVEEFALLRARPASAGRARVPASGPRIVLAVGGSVDVVAGSQRATLRQGQSVLVADADGSIDVEGGGTAVVAAVAVVDGR